jgi:plastocyanin
LATGNFRLGLGQQGLYSAFAQVHNSSVPSLSNYPVTNNSNKSLPLSLSNNMSFPKSTKVTIVIGAALKRDKAFQPNPIFIAKNGTVTWINKDTVTHTVTSGNGISDPNMGKEFDSGMLGKGFSFMFGKSGNFSYFCQVHPTMIGKVVVQ